MAPLACYKAGRISGRRGKHTTCQLADEASRRIEQPGAAYKYRHVGGSGRVSAVRTEHQGVFDEEQIDWCEPHGLAPWSSAEHERR